jgi:hypothetical protein
MRRVICRLRGHVEHDRTVVLEPTYRVVVRSCGRCHERLGERVQPALARLDASAIGLPDVICYATGEVGDCGHCLAVCWGQCGGSYCPRCRGRCEDCQSLSDAVGRSLALTEAWLELASEKLTAQPILATMASLCSPSVAEPVKPGTRRHQ